MYNLRDKHNNGPLTNNFLNSKQFKLLDVDTISFSIASPDNCLILKDKRIGIVEKFLNNCGKPLLLVRFYRNVEELYDIPVSSTIFDIYLVSELSCDLCEIDIDLLETKIYLIPNSCGTKMAAFPIAKYFRPQDL